VEGSYLILLHATLIDMDCVQNFGIVVVFGIGFFVALLVFTELNTSSAADTPVLLFKRGSKKAVAALENGAATTADAEKAGGASGGEERDQEAIEEALAAAPPMTDVFSWENLNYVVPVKDGKRKLLDNISGYVVPGKLTALMYACALFSPVSF
jgi:ATP-binding cassette subfamily G (WHITE) protein 2 (SNQ2)